MALRRWRGVLVTEDQESGDGRVLAPGSLEWPDLPLPLGWLERQMHGDLLEGATQIGNIQTITRSGNDLVAAGVIDDEIPEGAELIRRMAAGSAPMGNRVGLSIDPDNWAVELWDTTATTEEGDGEAEDVLMLVASGTGPLPRRSVTAAAGDPDRGGEGVLLMTDTAGDWLERYTRLRVRGVTACAIQALITGYMELDGEAVTAAMMGMPDHAFMDEDGDGFCDYCVTAAEDGACTMRCAMSADMHSMVDGTQASGSVTAAALLRTTSAPPRFAFELPEPEPGMHDDGDLYGMPVQELLVTQPDGGLAVPVTFAERDWGWQVFGHAARWGQCHVGYLDECVTAPPSNAAYAHYHVGEVECSDGSRVSTGALTANCDHAAAHLLAPEARDHYAHSGMAFADVRATNGELGVWISGALRPSITDDQLRVLRASSLSGDWRRIGADLEFIAALAVNVPGFPIAREFVTASGLHMARASLAASAHVDNGQVMSLTASGVVQRCADCAARQRAAERAAGDGPEVLRASAELVEMVRRIELRTRHLVPTAAEHALSVVKKGEKIAPKMAAPARVRRPRNHS